MAPLKSLVLTWLLCLICSGQAAPVLDTQYDVVIVGGGPAGLSALSGLSRVRRKTLLIDSGEYRNALTRHMHDVIGYDGVVPAEFRAHARMQISRYDTATILNETVTSITAANNATSFITVDSAGSSYTSRKIILATGLVDILPDTPGVKEAWSRGLYWCPWCDGYEHRDQSLGVLGSIVDVPGTILEVHNQNRDVIAFVNGTYTDANVAILNQKRPGWEKQLRSYNVFLENRTITSIERLQDGAVVQDTADWQEYDLFEVNLEDEVRVQRAAFISNFPSKQRSYLGESLGVRVYGEKMSVDPASMRAAPGVWAVGDANSDNSTNVPHAMYSGKKAAVYAHVEIEREYAATLLRKRDEDDVLEIMGRDVEELWESLKRGS